MKRINFRTEDLRALVEVGTRLSFSAAAEALHVSQPALSRRIDKLEATLRLRLFDRTTRRVALSESGRQFLLHAQAALDLLEQAAAGVSDRAERRASRVTVACVPSVANDLLPRMLRRFCADHDAIRVRVIDESAPVVLDSVLSGAADFGLNFIGAQEADAVFEPVLEERYVLVMREEHRLARRRSVAWAELADERMVSVSSASGNRGLIDRAVARLKRRPAIFYEANHVAGALGLVEAGLGVAALPRLALAGSSHRTLLGVPLIRPVIDRTLGLLVRKGTVLDGPALALYDLLRRELATKRYHREP